MAWTSRVVNENEREQFDTFIASHPKGHILQTWAWGQVKKATGWEPHALVVEDAGQIAASILLLEHGLPGTRRSFFYAPRGPVVDIDNAALFDFLLGAVKEMAKERGAIMLKIDPDVPVHHEGLAAYLKSRGFRPAPAAGGFEGTQPRFVFRLNITPSPEEIMAAFQPKTRYNIRLAERKGVTIKENCTLADLQTFYDLLQETAHRDHFLIRSYSYFATLWRELVERGYARLLLAHYRGEAIAGTLMFLLGNKAWYLYGASSSRHREVMPNYLLQWTMICRAREAGCTMYDFRGVPGILSPDNPLYGLYRFKKGFGGTYTEFIGEYDLVYAPLFYRLWNVAEPLYYRGVRWLRRN